MADVALAINPADLTGYYKHSPLEYYKVTYDGGPKYFLAKLPFEEDFSFMLYGWQNEEATERIGKFRIAKKFSPCFDLTFGLEGEWKKGNFIPKQEVAFDFHKENFGFGVVFPFQSEDKIKIGPRFSIGDFTTYLTLSEENDYCLGLGYAKDGMKFEFAYDERDIWYFRTSRGFKTNFGKMIPEFRIKVTPDKIFFGIGIGFLF